MLPFAALAERRGDAQQALFYRASAERLTPAIEQSWDGEWYRRAYFDDGTPLGSHVNLECRIDVRLGRRALSRAWGRSAHAPR